MVLLQVTNDLRSSFDLSVNHLGVLLHDEAQVLVLHGSHVGVDRWDGRDHFAKLQLMFPAVGTALLSPAVGTALFTCCGSALSRCGCSFRPLWVRSFLSSCHLDHPFCHAKHLCLVQPFTHALLISVTPFFILMSTCSLILGLLRQST